MPKFRELLEKAKQGKLLDESNSRDPTNWWSRHIGYKLDEDAPPGMEDWIKDRKPEFKKRYGDRWKEVLYATAWKMKDKINDTKGGGKVTQVPLSDEIGASSEGEIAGQAYNTADHQLVDETPGETNITRSGPGTGTPHSPWIATDAFNFSETTLAATKGIKRANQDGDNEDGKKVKMMKDPDGSPRPDYKDLGVKDVNGADNLSDEAENPEMKNSAYEEIRVDHVTKGKGTVLEITENHIEVDWDRSSLRILGPEKLPFSETKYLTRIQERYSDNPEEVDVDDEDEPKGIKKMTKKQKVDEAMVAIKPTLRNTGDGYKLPVIDLSPEEKERFKSKINAVRNKMAPPPVVKFFVDGAKKFK